MNDFEEVVLDVQSSKNHNKVLDKYITVLPTTLGLTIVLNISFMV